MKGVGWRAAVVLVAGLWAASVTPVIRLYLATSDLLSPVDLALRVAVSVMVAAAIAALWLVELRARRQRRSAGRTPSPQGDGVRRIARARRAKGNVRPVGRTIGLTFVTAVYVAGLLTVDFDPRMGSSMTAYEVDIVPIATLRLAALAVIAWLVW
jgi:hypothetical protein